jgi:hypothetical protein
MKHKPDTEEFGWMDFYFFTERSDLVGASSQTTLAILDSKGDDLVYYYNNALWVGGWEWDDAMSTHTDVNQLIQDRVCGTASKICLANVDNDSTIVDYTGPQELFFSYTKVIAVLVWPPHHGGIPVRDHPCPVAPRPCGLVDSQDCLELRRCVPGEVAVAELEFEIVRRVP